MSALESLQTLVTEAAELGLSVHVTTHDVPTDVMLDWLQRGLLDSIDKGAMSNPPTGNADRLHEPSDGRLQTSAFMARRELPLPPVSPPAVELPSS